MIEQISLVIIFIVNFLIVFSSLYLSVMFLFLSFEWLNRKKDLASPYHEQTNFKLVFRDCFSGYKMSLVRLFHMLTFKSRKNLFAHKVKIICETEEYGELRKWLVSNFSYFHYNIIHNDVKIELEARREQLETIIKNLGLINKGQLAKAQQSQSNQALTALEKDLAKFPVSIEFRKKEDALLCKLSWS